jgi:hypothetical protein
MQNARAIFVMKTDIEICTEVRKYKNILLYNEVLWDKYNMFHTPVQHSIIPIISNVEYFGHS